MSCLTLVHSSICPAGHLSTPAHMSCRHLSTPAYVLPDTFPLQHMSCLTLVHSSICPAGHLSTPAYVLPDTCPLQHMSCRTLVHSSTHVLPTLVHSSIHVLPDTCLPTLPSVLPDTGLHCTCQLDNYPLRHLANLAFFLYNSV
jgi:hypothetical protein